MLLEPKVNNRGEWCSQPRVRRQQDPAPSTEYAPEVISCINIKPRCAEEGCQALAVNYNFEYDAINSFPRLSPVGIVCRSASTCFYRTRRPLGSELD